MEPLVAITRLAEEMAERHSLEALLQLIADRTAEILAVRRVSVRLLDPSHTLLMAVARAGEPLHDRPVVFRIGEGLIGWIALHSQPLRLADAESDPRFAPRPGMAPMGSFVGVPIRAGMQCTGVISSVDDGIRHGEQHERLLSLIAAMCGPYVEMARLARLSRVDPLTGTLNLRGLDESFPEVSGGEEPGMIMPLSVAMVDIDHLRRVNDALGHAVGDLVLRHVTGVLAHVLRAGDAVVRHGGEEFLLILPEVDRERAAAVAERARAAVETSPTPAGNSQVPVTISIGIAERHPGESRAALIARAERALAASKAAGRNRVTLAD